MKEQRYDIIVCIWQDELSNYAFKPYGYLAINVSEVVVNWYVEHCNEAYVRIKVYDHKDWLTRAVRCPRGKLKGPLHKIINKVSYKCNSDARFFCSMYKW